MQKFLALIIAFGAAGALAGNNCKCQDPSGTSPQWDGLTQQASNLALGDEANGAFCVLNKQYHADQHHQLRLSCNV
ncbi:hypothetical protein BJY04DRAFT_178500 [Aspergillus karnatakaensis]|uniref:uncharacterized protein n=1 Tax=Aspergillus karnatakaensis TaxID=1810916 RepID=UPI003CCDFEFD